MPTAYKVLGQSYPTANTATTLYTVPSSTSAVVSTLSICNTSTDTDTISIMVRPGGASLENKHYIFKNMSVGANGTMTVTCGMTLATTDVLSVLSSTGTSSFTAFGSEIS